MVRVCSLNLFSQTRAASMLSSQIVLHTFHWKHVEWLPFWFLVLKLPQNPDFHATHPLMQWRMKFSIDGSRVLPQSVFTDQSCINVILFVVNMLNAFHFGFLFWIYNRIRSFMPPSTPMLDQVTWWWIWFNVCVSIYPIYQSYKESYHCSLFQNSFVLQSWESERT